MALQFGVDRGIFGGKRINVGTHEAVIFFAFVLRMVPAYAVSGEGELLVCQSGGNPVGCSDDSHAVLYGKRRVWKNARLAEHHLLFCGGSIDVPVGMVVVPFGCCLLQASAPCPFDVDRGCGAVCGVRY